MVESDSDVDEIMKTLTEGEMFTPLHSVEPSEAGLSQHTQASQLRTGFENAFQSLIPAAEASAEEDRARAEEDTSRMDEGRDWPIPSRYIRHWDRVPEALKNVPIPPSTYFRGPCLVPAKEHRGKMYSTSKCFDILFQNDIGLLADPTMGVSYWFTDECMTDLPLHIQKVLYFFDSVKTHMARDYANYVFPCTDVALLVGPACVYSTGWFKN
jgi:hypothetical protein